MATFKDVEIHDISSDDEDDEEEEEELNSEEIFDRKINKKLHKEDNIEKFIRPLLEKEPAYRADNMEKKYRQVAKFMKRLKRIDKPRTNYIKKLNLQDCTKFEHTVEGLHKAFRDTLEILRQFTKSDESYLYLPTEDSKIYRYFNTGCEAHATRWPIAPGTTIVAYVAHVQKCLLLGKGSFTSKNHPLGIGRSGDCPNSAMFVPVISQDKAVLAVFEFDKKLTASTYTKDELNYVVGTVAWMTTAMTWREEKKRLLTERIYSYKLLKYMRQFLKGDLQLDTFVSNCMVALKQQVNADEVTYYSQISDSKFDTQVFEEVKGDTGPTKLVRKEKNILYDSNDDLKSVFEQINAPKPQCEGQEMYTASSSELGVLQVQIGSHRRTLGTVRLTRKNGTNFDEYDESLVYSAGVYCASALFYSAVAFQLDATHATVKRQKKSVTYHLVPCSHDLLLFQTRDLIKPSSNYTNFAWYPTMSELNNLLDYTYFLYKDLFDGDPIMDKLHYYILTCRKGYRDVGYHNFEHAFHATHSMYCIITSTGQRFNYFEQLALMIAMLCHDLDHRGYTNNYTRQSNDDLCVLYRDSFLENHHCDITKMVVQETELLSHLSHYEYKSVLDEIHNLIMATDLKLYFRKKTLLSDLLKKGMFNENASEHKILLKKVMMTSCDLSGQCKPFNITQRLTYNLYQEFYHEGDKLRELGIEPMAVMDRNNYLDIPSDQIHFLSEVVMPCVSMLSDILPETKEMFVLASTVCDTWRGEKAKRLAAKAVPLPDEVRDFISQRGASIK